MSIEELIGYWHISDVLSRLVDTRIFVLARLKPQIVLPLFVESADHSGHIPSPLFEWEEDFWHPLHDKYEWQCNFCLQYLHTTSLECPQCD